MKRLLTFLGAGLALLLLVGAGGYVYAGSAAADRLSVKYEVEGKDIPIPFPLTEAELEALREERRAAVAPAEEPAPEAEAAEAAAEDADPTEEADDATAPAETIAEEATEEAAPGEGAEGGDDAADPVADAEPEPAAEVDPLEGVDLEAVAMKRAVARGEALVLGRLGCAECHGTDGQGKLIVDAQPVWTWYAPNITRGGKTKDYTGRDWDRIIRHGVKPDGTPATMPSEDFKSLSDREVSDLAAYFSSQPASDVEQPPTVLGPVGKGLIGFHKLPISAEGIDHEADHPLLPPEEKVDLAFGGHAASACVGCHRSDFNGGPIAQGPPDWPPAANLTPHPDGRLADWTEEDFIRVLREATRPDGSKLQEPMASFTKFKLSETEMRAMFLYLKQLPPTPTGE